MGHPPKYTTWTVTGVLGRLKTCRVPTVCRWCWTGSRSLSEYLTILDQERINRFSYPRSTWLNVRVSYRATSYLRQGNNVSFLVGGNILYSIQERAFSFSYEARSRTRGSILYTPYILSEYIQYIVGFLFLLYSLLVFTFIYLQIDSSTITPLKTRWAVKRLLSCFWNKQFVGCSNVGRILLRGTHPVACLTELYHCKYVPLLVYVVVVVRAPPGEEANGRQRCFIAGGVTRWTNFPGGNRSILTMELSSKVNSLAVPKQVGLPSFRLSRGC